MADTQCWLAFGDIHDDISRLNEISELPVATGVIITGDITFAGGIEQAEKALLPIAERTPILMAQIGNMDKAEVNDWLEDQDWNLHRRARSLCPGVVAFGVGCSPFTPFNTPSEYSEDVLMEWMEEAYAEAVNYYAGSGDRQSGFPAQNDPILIFVSHSPPHACACDRLLDGTPVGSRAVREFIEKRQPNICLCGHIHESRSSDRIGRTHILNPGTLLAGGYVVLHIDDTPQGPSVRAELKKL